MKYDNTLKVNYNQIGNSQDVDDWIYSYVMDKIIKAGQVALKYSLCRIPKKDSQETIKELSSLIPNFRIFFDEKNISHNTESQIIIDHEDYLSIMFLTRKKENKQEFIDCSLLTGDVKVADLVKIYFEDNFTYNSKNSVYVVATGDSGALRLHNLGSIESVLERDNYSEEVLKGYDYVIEQFQKEQPFGRLAIINGPPGCQPSGSKVLMANGSWKNIENIIVGDVIKSPQKNGTVIDVVVLETLKYDNKDIYKIETNNKSKISYLASHNHILPIVELSKKYKNKRKFLFSRLTEMDIDSYNKRGKNWKSKARLFTSPAYDLPEKKLKIHPYLMGCVLGDGSLNKNVNNSFIFSEDIILEEIKNLGAEFGVVTKDKRSKAKSVRFINKTEKELTEILGTPNSHTKKIPDEYLNSSLNQRLELLAGLIDTDGTKEEFSSVSLQLAEAFKHLIFSIGGYANLKKRFTKCKGKSFSSYRVHYSLGEYQIPTRLKYKRQNKRNMKWKNLRNKNFNVSFVRKDTVYGFSLSGDSQWYITDNFIVTHNTGKTFLIRNLINHIKNCIIVLLPSKLVGEIDSPALISLLAEEKSDFGSFSNKSTTPFLFIVEDADACLLPREGDNIMTISSLLNYTDGILGSMLDIRVVATTNADHIKFDEALTRPGRMCRHIFVDMLLPDKANQIYERLTGKEKYYTENVSLAQVYADTNEKFEESKEIKKKKVMGF